MTEIICIDDNFNSDVISYFAQFGIIMPKLNKIYSIRKIVNHANGKKGILLNEIINNKVPTFIISVGMQQIEPTWNIKRFTTLDGNKIEEKNIKYVEMEK